MADFWQTISSIDKASFDNESDRLRTLLDAKALVRRLQKPHELIEDLIWTNPFSLSATKIASDMGVFQYLSTSPQTAQDLALKTGADVALVNRVMRMLAATNIVYETAPSTFIDNELSTALKDRTGPISGIEYFWAVGAIELAGLPQYLRQTGYQNPSDVKDTPFSHLLGSASYWEYMHANPETHAHFNSYMSTLRRGQAPWTDVYPVERLLADYDASSVLCVDIGGGKGRDMVHLCQALPSSHSSSRVVLQDLPTVIVEARNEVLSTNVLPTSHDFFTTQPVQGARAYFMHSILHDWPDQEAERILARTRDAMKSGYSKLLIYETVMPTISATPRMAAIDLNMMCHFASLERTEDQWKRLLSAVGMTWKGFYARPSAHQGIIEVELSS